jgi:hypothetical protein
VYTQAIYAEVDLVAARYAISKGQPPERFFQESERIAQACLSVNPDSAECLETLAANYLLRAEYHVSLKRPAHREIALGIKHVDHSLSVNPKNALTRVYRGKLFLLRAQSRSGISRKQDALEAKQSFEGAFQIRKTLRREYAKFLDAAEQLAESAQ